MINKVLEIIKGLDNVEKKFLIFQLLVDKDIDFTDISLMYTKYLEALNNKQQTEKRLIADCLTAKYNEYSDMEFINARSSILLYPYVPNEFIKKYVLKGTNRKAINKEKKFLKEQLNWRD